MNGLSTTHPAARTAAVLAAGAMRLGSVGLALFLGTPLAWAADRTDVVILDNGDRLTGEIKRLERGELTLKTDALGTVAIEWARIQDIQTRQRMEIAQADGRRIHGYMAASGTPGSVLIQAEDEHLRRQPVPLASMVHITPLSEGGWLGRVDGSASVGISAASTNQDRQLTVSASIDYRDVSRTLSASYDAARTESANNPVSERQSLNTLYRGFPRDRWFWAATATLTSNDALDLNLRTLVGAGAGRHWRRDARRELWGLVGLATVRENYRNDTSHQNVEMVLQGDFELFRFEDPDIDVSAKLTLYPSLSVHGRLRSEVNLYARLELVKNLYYELSYLRSQDNRPPTGGPGDVDWSLASSLGYKF